MKYLIQSTLDGRESYVVSWEGCVVVCDTDARNAFVFKTEGQANSICEWANRQRHPGVTYEVIQLG